MVAHLSVHEAGLLAYRRYNRVDPVHSFEDVLELVHGCAHGRSFFNSYWLKVLSKFEMSNPTGSL